MKKVILVSYPFSNPAARHRILLYKQKFDEDEYLVESIVFPRDYSFTTYLLKYILLQKICRAGDIVINNRVFYFRNVILLLCAMLIMRCRSKHIFDYDDAIYLGAEDAGNCNGIISTFKKIYRHVVRGSVTRSGRYWPIVIMLKYSKMAYCGNEYLEEFARRHCNKSIVVPTVLTVKRAEKKKMYNSNGPIVLGWLGTSDNMKYLSILERVFHILSQKYGDRICLKIVAGKEFVCEGLNVINKKWSYEQQMADLRTFDIGLMPLPNDTWVLGKCGFKAILYHSVGLPVVASDVGVSKNIVIHKQTGYLANNDNEWINYLSNLVESCRLRKLMGNKGYNHIKANYSLECGYNIIKSSLADLLG